MFFFFFQAEDGIRDIGVTGVQTCALPIFDPQLPQPIPQGALRRPLLPKRVRATEIRAVRSDDSSNARHVFADAARSIQNVFGILQLSRPIPQSLCSPKPPCAPLEDASRRAASPATA